MSVGRISSTEKDENTTQYSTSLSLGNQESTKTSGGGFFMRSFAAPVSSSIDWATRKKNKRYGDIADDFIQSAEDEMPSRMLETITDEAEL